MKLSKFLLIGSVSFVVCGTATATSINSCKVDAEVDLYQGVVLQDHVTCQNNDNSVSELNVLNADISSQKVKVAPLVISNTSQLQTLPQIATQNSNVIAGVNGGFFYNAGTDPDTAGSYRDNICPYKTYPQTGNLGDSLLQIGGQVISYPCDTVQHSLRSVFVMDAANNMYVTQVAANNSISENGNIPNVIGAGPTLVKDGAILISQESFDWYYTRAARTSVGTKDNHVFLVTIDKSSNGGMTISELADFMANYLHVDTAMNLDGGGSTTMCTVGSDDNCDVVNKPSDPTGTRAIYDGLFLLKQ